MCIDILARIEINNIRCTSSIKDICPIHSRKYLHAKIYAVLRHIHFHLTWVSKENVILRLKIHYLLEPSTSITSLILKHIYI